MPAEEEREQAWREIEAIRSEIEASPGRAKMQSLQTLARSHRLFVGNQRELLAFVEKCESPESLAIWDVDHPERLDDALDEVDRLLHNFLAASFSLAEHLERFRDVQGSGSALAAGYKERDPFQTSSLVQFVARLRNIAQHQRLPVTSGGIRGWRDNQGQLNVEQFFVLDRRALQRYEWKHLAREHLRGFTADPRLAPLVVDYSREMRGFADWLAGEFVRVNLTQLEELFRLHESLGPANAIFRDPRL